MRWGISCRRLRWRSRMHRWRMDLRGWRERSRRMLTCWRFRFALPFTLLPDSVAKPTSLLLAVDQRADYPRRHLRLSVFERTVSKGACSLLSFPESRAHSSASQETLSGRDAVVSEHREAVKTTIARRRAIDKLRSASSLKADKVNEALEELDEVRLSLPVSPSSLH